MRICVFSLLFVVGSMTTSAQDLSASHMEAARELLAITGTEALMVESVDSMIQLQLEQNPDLVPFQDILRSFLREHLSWEAIGEDFVRIYTESFSEAELREITAFYQTETGQKAVQLMPSLMAQGMELGQRAVIAHQGELEARVQDRIDKMSRQPSHRRD